MFRESYRKLNQSIQPSQQLIEITVEKARACRTKPRVVWRAVRKPVLIVGALAVFVTVGMPALASVEPVYQIMYGVSPKVAQFFKPVRMSCESNGIQMEVVSAYVHGGTAEIYITMRDLEGDRVDGTTDLNDSYAINIPFDCSAHCQRTGYDEETKTVTFLVTVDGWGNADIAGKKITFSVKNFLSHKTYYDEMQLPISLTDVPQDAPTQMVQPSGGNLSVGGHKLRALVPSEPRPEFPVDGIDFTGLAYVDGQLHIQTRVLNNFKKDNHGWTYLKDANGQQVSSVGGFSFCSDWIPQDGRMDYTEIVYDISPEELAECTLWGRYVTSGLYTEGNWNVTFRLQDAPSADRAG